MNTDIEQLRRLEQLQEIDLDLLRSNKALAELPERKTIHELRLKKEAILEKKNQVETVKRSSDEELKKIHDEEEGLETKQSFIQKKIDGMKGDYRLVESYSKDLAGIAKRRNTLEAQVGDLEGAYKKIEAMEEQISEALSLLDTQEKHEIRAFREKGGALQDAISQGEKDREAVLTRIDPLLLEKYQRKAKHSGGIAISRLRDASCSVCRSTFPEGKLLQILAEAPLSSCPSCKRMMVVEHD